MFRFRLNLAAITLLLLCLSISASADSQSVTLSFDTPVLGGNPGGSPLDFFYTITVDPGADDFTLTDFDVSLPALGPGAVEVISSPFPLTVSAGETHTDDFLVIIPDPFPGGSYGGVLTVQGNLGATLFDLPANFTVNVNGPTNTPEPDTALLLLSALGAMLLSRRFLHLRPVHISCKKA